MSRREALHGLQERLAERMRRVRAEPGVPGWLAVSCAGHGLLLPLAEAGEIFEPRGLLAVPHTRPWFAGVVNLRGSIHTVVDLARFLGLRETPTRAAAPQPCAVSLNPSLGVASALLVDRLDGLRNPAQLQRVDGREAAPEASVAADGAADGTTGEASDPGKRANADADSDAPAFATGRWRDAAGRLWQEISLRRLADEAGFLWISA